MPDTVLGKKGGNVSIRGSSLCHQGARALGRYLSLIRYFPLTLLQLCPGHPSISATVAGIKSYVPPPHSVFAELPALPLSTLRESACVLPLIDENSTTPNFKGFN